jgi:hypothetical protein
MTPLQLSPVTTRKRVMIDAKKLLKFAWSLTNLPGWGKRGRERAREGEREERRFVRW